MSHFCRSGSGRIHEERIDDQIEPIKRCSRASDCGCWARYTTPIPPSPMSERIRYVSAIWAPSEIWNDGGLHGGDLGLGERPCRFHRSLPILSIATGRREIGLLLVI